MRPPDPAWVRLLVSRRTKERREKEKIYKNVAPDTILSDLVFLAPWLYDRRRRMTMQMLQETYEVR